MRGQGGNILAQLNLGRLFAGREIVQVQKKSRDKETGAVTVHDELHVNDEGVARGGAADNGPQDAANGFLH